MHSTGELLAARLTSLQDNTSSIESNASNTINSIDIPAEVDALIDNKAYYPKFRKLLREHPREIMALVELAYTKANPSHWFAVATAKRNWERTLTYLAQLFKVRELAQRTAQRLGTSVTRFIYKQVWRGVNVERWAATAAEAGRHKSRYFAWLCQREAQASG